MTTPPPERITKPLDRLLELAAAGLDARQNDIITPGGLTAEGFYSRLVEIHEIANQINDEIRAELAPAQQEGCEHCAHPAHGEGACPVFARFTPGGIEHYCSCPQPNEAQQEQPAPPKQALRFYDLQVANRSRNDSPVGFDPICREWTPNDWMVAACGELGEAANKLKKLRRGESIDIREDIGYELADTVIYLDLLAQRLGLSLGELVTAKFNITSKRIGLNVALGTAQPQQEPPAATHDDSPIPCSKCGAEELAPVHAPHEDNVGGHSFEQPAPKREQASQDPEALGSAGLHPTVAKVTNGPDIPGHRINKSVFAPPDVESAREWARSLMAEVMNRCSEPAEDVISERASVRDTAMRKAGAKAERDTIEKELRNNWCCCVPGTKCAACQAREFIFRNTKESEARDGNED